MHYTNREITLRIAYIEKAIKLQAREYERRLEGLNHEASNLKSMQSTYVSQESYDIKYAELNHKLDILTRFKDNVQGSLALYPLVALVISLAVTIALHFWR